MLGSLVTAILSFLYQKIRYANHEYVEMDEETDAAVNALVDAQLDKAMSIRCFPITKSDWVLEVVGPENVIKLVTKVLAKEE